MNTVSDVIINSEAEHQAYEMLRGLGCSEVTAWRILGRCWPHVESCLEEAQRRRKPALIALEVFSQQREYMWNLRNSILPIDKPQFPCFREENRDKPSDGYPTLTWAEVADKINTAPPVEIFFLDGESHLAANFENYEKYYQNNILAEGFMDIVAFTTTVDGLVPLVDYLHVRHFGGVKPSELCIARGPSMLSSGSGSNGNAGSRVMPGRRFDMMHIPENNNNNNSNNDNAEGRSALLQSFPHRSRILLGNDVFTSIKQRQNKDGMQQTLRSHGLAHIRGIAGYSVQDAKQWRRENHIPFPVVVKPVSGAGSELVTLCYSEEEISTAFSLARDVKTTQMTDASHILVQEYIEGSEYVVNVVSYNGKHVVSDVWKSWKYPISLYSTRLLPSVEEKLRREYYNSGHGRNPHLCTTTAMLYDRIEFVHNLAELNADSEERRVVAYVLQCVDALGMRQGCSHCEVRVDNRPGSRTYGMPILIELNPRMLGDTPRATRLVGYDQYTLLMYLVLSAVGIPEDVLLVGASGNNKDGKAEGGDARAMLPWPPAPLLYRSLTTEVTCHVVFLRAADRGVVCNACAQKVMSLPTFSYFTRGSVVEEFGKCGGMVCVVKTVDLLTSPVACVLNGSEADIRRDTAYIRRVENKDLKAWFPLLRTAVDLLMQSQGQEDVNSSSSSGETHRVSTCDVRGTSRDVQSRPPRENQKFNAALDAVVSFFNDMEPPLFVPIEYFLQLKQLGLEYLILGANDEGRANARQAKNM